MLTVKVQSKDLALSFDADEESDLVAHFKLPRASEPFLHALLPLCKLAFRDGELKLLFDWTGVKRVKLEAEAQNQKRQALKLRLEQEKQEREALHLQRQAEAKLAQAQQAALEAQALRDHELRVQLEAKREADRLEKEKWDKLEAMGAKFTSALLLSKPAVAEGAPPASTNIERGFDELKGCFYFVDMDSNSVTWRDPRLPPSPWEKSWVESERQFHFTNTQTGEVLLEEPYCAEVEKIWVEDNHCFYYVDKVTGDTSTEEPYY